jgi:hypothetical protein
LDQQLLFDLTLFCGTGNPNAGDRLATDAHLSCMPLFGCQNLMCAPPRSNAFPTIYPPMPATDFAQFSTVKFAAWILVAPIVRGRFRMQSSAMRDKKTSRSNPVPPHCPSCAQAMRLARKTRRFNGLPDLYIFECRTCDMSHTEEGTPPSETKFKTEIGSWYLDEFGNPTREIKRRD